MRYIELWHCRWPWVTPSYLVLKRPKLPQFAHFAPFLKSQTDDDKSSLKGRVNGHVTHFRPPEISLQRLQLKTSNFVHELATWSISLFMINCPQMGVVVIMWHILDFYTPWNVSASATASSYVHELATWSINLLMTKYPPSGRGQGQRDLFLHFGDPNHISGADEARHFKFCLQIERKEYWHYTC